MRLRPCPGLKSHPVPALLGEHFSLAKRKNPHTNLQSKIKESSILKKLIEAHLVNSTVILSAAKRSKKNLARPSGNATAAIWSRATIRVEP
jgi:hypothetical protein